MQKQLTILQINDVHGYLNEHYEMFRKGNQITHKMVGGYARINSCFKKIRKEKGSENVLAFDCGDTLHGTYLAVETRGEVMVEPLNLLKLDVWTIHWDFVYGANHLKEISEKLNYPLLSCNCHSDADDELLFKATQIFERGGVKVGVIGIGAYIIDKSFPKRISKGYYFTLGNVELPRHIKNLRENEGAEIIIVLSHLGFSQDCKLASEVDGIDILLSGHTHNRIYKPTKVNNTTIIQSDCHGSFVGQIKLEVKDGKISKLQHELIVLDEKINADVEMQQMIDEIYAPHQKMLIEIVGETTTDLNRYTALESTMDNFLLDAIAHAAGTEIAFSNGWRYGVPIPKGKITNNELWNIIPVNPKISVTEITGQELWQMMEESLEKTYARDPYKQMGGYVKRCRGLNVFCKIENEFGQRIQEFFAEGESLDYKKIYRVAFVTEQGVSKKYGKNRKELSVNAIDALRNYLKEKSPIEAELRNTVVAV
ncbi:MAG: 5'-nucleotidase C-terminal domain-containing protein [Flavobacteriaceae bacterium]|nr:5'-nucleotidase C-terminal domain-containing protein [Flavobacteriaceae bacterium]